MSEEEKNIDQIDQDQDQDQDQQPQSQPEQLSEQQQPQSQSEQNQFQQQPQQSQQSTNIPTPSQAECMAFVKFARYTALTADRLAGALLQMTAKLEDEGILKCGRSSRLERDKKLRLYAMNIQKSDSDINDMMKLIPNHPDAERLIQSLFRGMRSNAPGTDNMSNLTDTNLNENIQDPINSILSNNDTTNNNANEIIGNNDQPQENNDIINNEAENQSQIAPDSSNNDIPGAIENVSEPPNTDLKE